MRNARPKSAELIVSNPRVRNVHEQVRAPPTAYTEPVPETQTSPTPDGVWLDEGDVNPDWAPPASGPPPTSATDPRAG